VDIEENIFHCAIFSCVQFLVSKRNKSETLNIYVTYVHKIENLFNKSTVADSRYGFKTGILNVYALKIILLLIVICQFSNSGCLGAWLSRTADDIWYWPKSRSSSLRSRFQKNL